MPGIWCAAIWSSTGCGAAIFATPASRNRSASKARPAMTKTLDDIMMISVSSLCGFGWELRLPVEQDGRQDEGKHEEDGSPEHEQSCLLDRHHRNQDAARDVA